MRNYPINFVVKHQNLFSLSRKARPEAVETFQSKTSNWSASKSEPLNGVDWEAANAIWWS
jgi:hypothetical protein